MDIILDKIKEKLPELSTKSCMELESLLREWYSTAKKQEEEDEEDIKNLSLGELLNLKRPEPAEELIENTSKEKKRKKVIPTKKDSWWEMYPIVTGIVKIESDRDEIELYVKEEGPGNRKSVQRTASKDTLAELLKNPRSKSSLAAALGRYSGEIPEDLKNKVKD